MTVLRRFRQEDEGAALVEFALLIPTIFMFFAVAIESTRLFWSYQSAIAGVRDAARFVGRAAPSDVCETGGTLASYDATALDIVQNTSADVGLFPVSMQITSAVADLTCVTGDYRMDQTPLATVTATLQITFPFAPVFTLFGMEQPTVTTSISDTTRVFGA